MLPTQKKSFLKHLNKSQELLEHHEVKQKTKKDINFSKDQGYRIGFSNHSTIYNVIKLVSKCLGKVITMDIL